MDFVVKCTSIGWTNFIPQESGKFIGWAIIGGLLARFGANLSFGQIVRSCRRSAGGKQMSTGHLHLDGSNLATYFQKKKTILWDGLFYLLA